MRHTVGLVVPVEHLWAVDHMRKVVFLFFFVEVITAETLQDS
jgi:hypothetical protein